MCGITGIIGGRADDLALLDAMARSIRHRGPDHTGTLIEPLVGLAMNRLSIIDLAGGNQPMHAHDGSASLIFNGEIYNYRALRAELASRIEFLTNSDTEVILRGYEVWGAEIFTRLNGIFSIAIWDRARNKLLLVRDPLGVKPLYLLRSGTSLMFSSEVKTFTQCGLANRVCPAAVGEYLRAGYVFHPRTAIAGVEQVAPGTLIEITPTLPLERRDSIYRLPGGSVAGSATGGPAHAQGWRAEDWSAEARHHLVKAIAGQTIADVPYGLLLSGGMDSMAILASLREAGLADNLKTFTVSFEDDSFSEHRPVVQLARGWKFHNELLFLEAAAIRDNFDRICLTFDNLELLPTCVAIYFASQLAGRQMRVLLSGNGGDELFFGYPTYPATRLARRLGPLAGAAKALAPLAAYLPVSEDYLTGAEKLRRFLTGIDGDPDLAHVQWRQVFTGAESARLLSPAYQAPAGQTYAPQLSEYRHARTLGHGGEAAYGWGDMRSWMVDCGLMMWDKAGMSASAEIRVPLVDPDLVDFLLTVPPEIRDGGKPGSKAFLREMFRGSLPDDIIARPKHGFQIPVARWLRGDLRNLFQQLTDELPPEIFSRTEIEELWKNFLERRQDNALKLWVLGSLAGWARAHRVSW
jgi:asparagine synthase (glutamine-hydrolysing)